MLFMKIDANSDGTVDWDEFTGYMMVGSMEDDDIVRNIVVHILATSKSTLPIFESPPLMNRIVYLMTGSAG